MTNVLISSLNLSGAESTEPMFDCGFNFQKIKVQSRSQTATGTMSGAVVAEWDVKLNK